MKTNKKLSHQYFVKQQILKKKYCKIVCDRNITLNYLIILGYKNDVTLFYWTN